MRFSFVILLCACGVNYSYQVGYIPISDKERIVNEIIDNLREEGYVIKDSSYELGIIRAEKVESFDDYNYPSQLKYDFPLIFDDLPFFDINPSIRLTSYCFLSFAALVAFSMREDLVEFPFFCFSLLSLYPAFKSEMMKSQKIVSKINEVVFNIVDSNEGYKLEIIYREKFVDYEGNVIDIKPVLRKKADEFLDFVSE